METPLTARAVQEALEERISRGIYERGKPLPPVRSIASEFGTSPSTVSRALQEMMRDGWIEVRERRFVRVRDQLAPREIQYADLQRSVRSIAHKWKLRGASKDELLETIREFVDQVFASTPNFVFAECNRDDLDSMAEQLERELPGIPIARSLISDLDPDKLGRANAVILAPYYHYTEVRACVGKEISIVPVHSSPTVDTLDELLTIPSGSRILIVGHNKRSVVRLSGMVRDYVDVKITGITLVQIDKISREAPRADVVVAVRSALGAISKIHKIKRLITVRFALETSLRDRLKSGDFRNGGGNRR